MKYTTLLLGTVLTFSTIVNAQNTPWKLNGNNVSSSKFLGTTNNKDLIFKANGIEGFRLKSTNNKLVFKGQSVFREKVSFNKLSVFKLGVKIKSLADSLAVNNRLIGINSNGKVIVVNSPILSDLTISNSLTALGNLNANNGITFSDGTVQTTAIDIAGGSNATFLDLDVTNRIKIGTNSLYLQSTNTGVDNSIYTDAGPLRINAREGRPAIDVQNTLINQNQGFVGIGTDAPAAKLHVVGNARIDNNIQLGSAPVGLINIGITPPTYVFGGGVVSGSCRIDAYGDPSSGGPILIGTPAPHSGGLILNGVSNNPVTIGNPVDKASNLNVHGKTYISKTLEVMDLVAFGTKLSDWKYGARLSHPASKAGEWYNMFVKDGIMLSRSSAAIYFRRGNDTDAPTAQVNGDIAMCLEDRPSGDPQFSSSTDPILGLNWFNPYPAQAAGGNWQMFISSSPSSAGFVGLGTPYPTARLTVNATGSEKVINVAKKSDNTDVFRVMGDGVVYATRVRVMDPVLFPDYVFNSTYDLMPLAQLENYITQNKHLPNMPTATEVEKEGMDLGEVNRVLVEKVEELTLYMIAMNKEIEQLKAVNQQLKK